MNFLQNVDARAEKAARRVVRTLTHKGWKSMDAGESCFVLALLASPCGTRVIKVASTLPKPCTGNTDLWPTFARWVWATQGTAHASPHLPKFYSFHEFRNIVVVCMERLQHADHWDESRVGKRISEQIEALDEINGAADWPYVYRRLPNSLRSTMRLMIGALGVPRDLHSRNVMVRYSEPRPVVVLIDPYGYV